jgi:hypothetical protein
MNKQIIFKWGKKISTIIGILIGVFAICMAFYVGYKLYYIPYHRDSLYHEGKQNPTKAEDNAQKLLDLDDYTREAHEKGLDLISYYAKKDKLWAQLLLEHYNEEHLIPLESNANINKHIWGITLGISTKQEVIDYLDSKGFSYKEFQEGKVLQAVNDFEFVGVYWKCINYYFTDDKVYKVKFMTREEYDIIKTSYLKLKDMLSEKYTKSKKFDLKYDYNKFSIKGIHAMVELESQDYDQGLEQLNLIYTDLDTQKKKYKQDLNSI